VKARGLNSPSPFGVVDWSDARSLLAVTQVLLRHDFHLEFDMPLNHLCPPVPQRLNYIHWVADLLGIMTKEDARNAQVRGIDVGTGASAIFPLLGYATYGWRFLGTEIDPESVASAQANIDRNKLGEKITVRHVASSENIFTDVILPSDGTFDFTLCNPPFFSSLSQTGLHPSRSASATPGELVCEGGEEAFVERMIRQSKRLERRVRWFTTMLGRKSSLKTLLALLRSPEISALVVDQTEFLQGQQARYGLAWSFGREERDKREATIGKDASPRMNGAQQPSTGAAAASSPAMARPPLQNIAPRQKIKFNLLITTGSHTADLATLTQHLRDQTLGYAASQGLTAEIIEVNSQQWKITLRHSSPSADGSSSAAPPLFASDLLLVRPSSREWMLDFSWRKPAPTKGAPTVEESKIAFTRWAITMQEGLK
jgi:23S rRNA A1618 N6-methylase RlmF